ncbi:hypothetical protein SARC_04375 [Sphaeroforma arctica JP610]|uniref:Peptidase S74 domain-containing protein n=1 Tax=Sphaeroforma arctica JP610 TaxID=667725 RepID=A0A0L0G2K7_9EUKA|nr:hypothetical protein SARC_04375 [Sphaeroforma arctica JP610]KNC83367.1 hypothetical protein SARC_04375 [Sphaeroforma arctica JP610]|eukprot:XP_014157269.1 hypothetical protein SARC_04375 [Sphaeroforma arctica JP610]
MGQDKCESGHKSTKHWFVVKNATHGNVLRNDIHSEDRDGCEDPSDPSDVRNRNEITWWNEDAETRLMRAAYGDTRTYRWNLKIPKGIQSSEKKSFYVLWQIKTREGGDRSPVMSLELRHTTLTMSNSFMVKPIRNAASPNALTYNPTTGEITYTTSTTETKGNIVPLTRNAGAILGQLEVKEFSYINKSKYIEYGTLGVAATITDWLVSEKANEGWAAKLGEAGFASASPEDTPASVGEQDTFVQQLYADYVAATEAVPETFVDKDETHFGFMAEEVQTILPELVYDDTDGKALDIKWNNITALLVKQNQILTAQIAELTSDTEARFATLEAK